MTEREALTRAILASPADDLPRLIFADWLDEHGEADRAAFIRVQCEMDRLVGLLVKPFLAQSYCSQLSDRFCPNCGDCCCPNPEDGMSDPNCPLHAPTSRHHSDSSLRSTITELERVEDALWTADGHGPKPDGLIVTRTLNYFGRMNSNHLAVYRRGFVNALVLPTVESFLNEHLDVVLHHPVREVAFTDTAPASVLYPERPPELCWVWGRMGLADRAEEVDPHKIPARVFDRLSRGRVTELGRVYPGIRAALEDLSDTVLLLAKETCRDRT